ncbi:MAG: hypothetical protein Kow00121_33150 [Elainellaceae cyanobacterium]
MKLYDIALVQMLRSYAYRVIIQAFNHFKRLYLYPTQSPSMHYWQVSAVKVTRQKIIARLLKQQ